MTSQASRIRWNSLFSFLSAFIRLGTNFIVFIGIARLYGSEAFGQFTTAHLLSTIFILFADFGFDQLLATEIARHRERANQLAQQYLSVKLIFCLVATIAMLLLPSIQHVSKTTETLIYIFSFYVILSSLNNFFFALFKGYEQLQHETKISFVINILLLCFVVFLGFFHVPLYVIALVFVGTRIVGFLVALQIAGKVFDHTPFRFSLRGTSAIWSQVIIFGVHYLFGSLFFQLDSILLAFWKGDHAVGIYQSVFKVIALTLVIPDIAINALMPALSRLHTKDTERWDMLGYLINKTLFLIALPITMILFVYSDQIIELLYGGKSFSEAIPIMRIFAMIVLIRFSVETYALMLTTSQKQKSRMVIVIAGTILNCGMNVYIIPLYGPEGAALTSLITNIAVGGGYLYLNRSFVVKWSFDLSSIIPFVVAGILSVILWKTRLFSVWFTVPTALAIYAFVLYFIGYSKKERMLVFANREALSHG